MPELGRELDKWLVTVHAWGVPQVEEEPVGIAVVILDMVGAHQGGAFMSIAILRHRVFAWQGDAAYQASNTG